MESRRSTVDSPCALLVDIAASVRGSADRRALAENSSREGHTRPPRHRSETRVFTPSTRACSIPTTPSTCLLKRPTQDGERRRPHLGFGGGFGGNVFPTPGEETGFFFMLPKKRTYAATQNEKATLKTKKNRKAEKHLKLGLPALKLAIAQNPIKGFFKAFFDFSPAEGSVTYAENTISTRK